MAPSSSRELREYTEAELDQRCLDAGLRFLAARHGGEVVVWETASARPRLRIDGRNWPGERRFGRLASDLIFGFCDRRNRRWRGRLSDGRHWLRLLARYGSRRRRAGCVARR